MATLLTTDDQTHPITEPLTLATMQRLVGGYIEVVTLFIVGNRREILILDEDGRRHERPINRRASALYGRDVIVGDVIHCTVIDAGEETERYE